MLFSREAENCNILLCSGRLFQEFACPICAKRIAARLIHSLYFQDQMQSVDYTYLQKQFEDAGASREDSEDFSESPKSKAWEILGRRLLIH